MPAHHKPLGETLYTGIPAHERRSVRMIQHAQTLLEGPLRRRNWTPDTRDALAAALEKIVADEIKRRNVE